MGKKSQRKRGVKQINSYKPQPSLPLLQHKRTSIFKSKLRGSCLFVGALILGIGMPEMIAGHEYAPFLIALGSLLVSLAIVTDDDIQSSIANMARSKWFRVVIYLSICVLFTFGPFILSYQYSNNQREELSKITILNGELTPGNKPMPSFSFIPSEVVVPPYNFVVMFGDLGDLSLWGICLPVNTGEEIFLGEPPK